MQLKLEFKAVLYDETQKEIADYLSGISRETVLTLGAHFLGFNHSNSQYDDCGSFISMFFRAENEAFANKILLRCRILESQLQTKMVIHNPISSLLLFEFAFESLSDEQTQTEAESEINLFKAYLVLNQHSGRIEAIASETTKHFPVDKKMPRMMFASAFHYVDLTNFNLHQVVITQVIKAIQFFKFISTHEKGKVLYDSFLRHFDVTNWSDYLRRILPLIIPILNHDKEAHLDLTIESAEHFEAQCLFLDKLSIVDKQPIGDIDFRIIRSSPFYKVEDGRYRVIYSLFVAEKLFKGLYFFFKTLNEALPKEQKVSNLRSLWGEEFTEKIMFYEVLARMYDNATVKYSGEEMKLLGLVGEPDYYARSENKIFVFESKDVLFDANLKHSGDYFLYERELRKRFYYDDSKGTRKPKAILQLVNNIKRVLYKELPFDTDYHYGSVFIYPVLVVSERQFNVVGLHTILNNWFKDELKKLKKEKFYVNRVKPLVVVDIDTLIYNQDLFQQGELDLSELVDAYVKYIQVQPVGTYKKMTAAKRAIDKSFVPFPVFVERQIDKLENRNVPQIVNELGAEMFELDSAS